MKKQIPPNLVSLLSVALWLLAARPASAQSATFVYQGRLTQAGNPATGSFDMQFKLFDTADVGTGTQRGDTKPNPTVPVTNGVFTVALDFGAEVFDGSPRFLEIGVRPGGSASPYSVLAPRQQVTSIPYAIHSLSASQLDGHPSTSFVQADSSGNVGIGAPAPPTDVKLLVNGNTRITTGGSGGYVQIGTPGGETGLSVLGKNRFDLRFNDQTLTLAANPGLGPPYPHYGLSMNTNGNVAIGMDSILPNSQWKLEINGPTRITPSFDDTAVEFSKPNGETGMSILAKNRADMRFDGSTLRLVAGRGPGVPPNENGLAIMTDGTVGIGTSSLKGKLGVLDTEDFGNAIHGKTIGEFGSGVYGEASALAGSGVSGVASGKGSVAVRAINKDGTAVYADGDAVQVPDKGGFVKAMAYIAGNGTVIRCYNSHPPKDAPATSTVPCGIEVFREEFVDTGAVYVVRFGFRVRDRFVMVTPRSAGTARSDHKSANFNYRDDDTISVYIWSPDDGNNELALDEFTIIVF